ncbi:hypothetical protein UFOVP898_72 [uncultured Caudovirales phage]|uniref:Uncharacterized protein n=1 Tax=uncultured Caudovirales phage TaxID=2100421 RepID=A0A6J5SB57_9CAUD|nr:hypothetical protein UFOVP898_72 [uncultured Caudovirales phage]CAB4176797.1 hypothetical protein UFOVP985_61 [uncultured Caudovirales phage]CAB4181865.1 hypothetical protein UFOVP1073_70 [uncultured Caudovirales phage]CAB4197843.1 hypothetical protein UFOVP1308_35 [uncultured Caudovirales phage]CAB4210632.1 hypothetical protein UFOVP1423_34 [uncultured Caudovirales phage]
MTFRTVLHDESNELRLGFASIEVWITYCIERGDPGYRYDSNGDGCPPSPDEAVLTGFTIGLITDEAGTPRLWQQYAPLHDQIRSWVDESLKDVWTDLESDLLDDAEGSK